MWLCPSCHQTRTSSTNWVKTDCGCVFVSMNEVVSTPFHTIGTLYCFLAVHLHIVGRLPVDALWFSFDGLVWSNP